MQSHASGKSALDEDKIAGGQRSAGDPPREPDEQAVRAVREHGAIGAELKLHRNAGDYAHGENLVQKRAAIVALAVKPNCKR